METNQEVINNAAISRSKKQSVGNPEAIDISGGLKLAQAREHILVVEDELPLCELLESYLSRLGYKVQGVPNGADALELTEHDTFDVYFLDLMLPGMDGFRLMKEIFSKSPNAYIIIMTAYGTLDNAMHAIREGAYEFVTKPFDLEVIGNILQRISEREQLIHERDLFMKQPIKTNEGNYDDQDNLISAIEMEMIKAREQETSVSLMLIQLENGSKLHKSIGNISIGKVFETLGKIVTSSIRSDDICTKFDDETYAVLLNQAQDKNAGKVAERLRDKIKEDFGVPFENFAKDIRIGLATTYDYEKSTRWLIEQAQSSLENLNDHKLRSSKEASLNSLLNNETVKN